MDAGQRDPLLHQMRRTSSNWVPFPRRSRAHSWEKPFTVGGDTESPRWRNAKVYSTGYVDLARYFRPPDHRLAYAFCNILAPHQCEGRILFGSDDGAKIWLNGELVYELDVIRGAVPDQEAIPVRLREGTNPVLLKVVNQRGTWGFYFRVVGEDGAPLPGLAFSVETGS